VITLATASSVLVTVVQVLLPPPDLSVSQWACTFRVLSREDSAAPGQWSSDSRPYQVGIMDACSDPRYQEVTVVGGSQWGKTQILLNICGRIIDVDPGPTMIVQPTERAAEKFSKTRLAPMLRDCPTLAAKADTAARSTSNTILEKTFVGGALIVMVGANAPSGLASQPIKTLLEDEIDRIPMDEVIGNEGDFEDLAEARTSDFEGRRLIYRCSTPTILGRSRIENSWKESDQRQWFVTCHECGKEQQLHWENVVYQVEDQMLPAPIYGCEGCGCGWSDPELRAAVLAGRWVATRPDVKGHAGFHVKGLMVRSMETLVKGFQKAKRRGIGALQVWRNTQLGEWWDPREGDIAQVDDLLGRANESDYTSGQVPDGVGILVGAVDVQDNRLELLVLGIGVGEETWRIQHLEITGNPAQPEVWDRLEVEVLREWPRVSGGVMKVRIACVDLGGHHGKEAAAFCKRKAVRGVAQPVRGATRPQGMKLAIRAGKKARFWSVDTVAAKDQILNQLKIPTPGYGYWHFPDDITRAYVEQLFAERRKPGKRIYEKISERNEALDLEVYARAALAIINPRDLEVLVQKAQALGQEGGAGRVRVVHDTPPIEPEGGVSEPDPDPPARSVRPPRRPRGFGGGGMGGAW